MLKRKDCRYKKILKGRVIIALHEALGRKPTTAEIEAHYQLAQILHATLLPYRLKDGGLVNKLTLSTY